MKQIEKNSAEAIGRIIALAVLADGRLANAELDALDRHGSPAIAGLSRDAFIQLIIDHCRELLEQGEAGRVRLMEPARLAPMLALVDDPAKRLLACRAIVVLSKADGEISRPEQALLRHLMETWQLTLDQVSGG